MKKFAFLIPLLVLTACGSTKTVKETDVITVPSITPNKPLPLNLQPVEFKIFDYSEINNMLAVDVNQETILITISVDSYNALTSNIADLRKYILQQEEVINFYERQNQNNSK